MDVCIGSFQGASNDVDWVCPRISFSQDITHMPMKLSPDRQKVVLSEEDFSFGMPSHVTNHDMGVDLLHPNYALDSMMCSPDQLFFNGKLLPLEMKHPIPRTHVKACSMELSPCCGQTNESYGESKTVFAITRSIEDKPRSMSMTIEKSRRSANKEQICENSFGAGYSLPSVRMNQVRTMPCDTTSSPVPTQPPASSPSSASSARYSSKIKDFFKLKKGSRDHTGSSSTSAAIGRECPQSSVSSSCRISTSKSFWPFSRSNSAGENKTPPAYPSPLPKRSNSSGEGKTTSSSLLQQHPSSDMNQDEQVPASTIANSGTLWPPKLSFSNHDVHHQLEDQSTANSCTNANTSNLLSSMKVHRVSCAVWGDDEIDFSTCQCTNSNLTSVNDYENLSTTTTTTIGVPLSTNTKPLNRRKGLPPLPTAKNSTPCRTMQDSLQNGKIRARSIRRYTNSTPARSFTRSSPGRRGGVWNSPGRGSINGTRVVIRSLERINKNVARPKSMLSRDGSSVRVPPVLNVPYMPARRGVKAPPRSKVFTLGGLFSKKDKDGRAYALLSTPLDC